MAMTLAQMAQVEQTPFKKYVILNLLRRVRLMELLPFVNVDSLTSVAVRWRSLPTGVAFRAINGSYTEATDGQTDQVWESVYGMGGEVKFDRVFDKIKNTIKDPKRIQIDMKLEVIARTFNDYLLNGDHATDADGFEGLKKRVASMPTRQSVYFAGSSSAALDVTASVANARTFFDKWEEMSYKCNAGQVGAFLLNENMYWGMGRAARYMASAAYNWLDTTKDSFDRDIVTYKGTRLVDVGLKRDLTTDIITDTETAGDAGADATSVYGVSLGEEDGIVGIQLAPGLETYDPTPGELQTAPAKLTRFEWWLGLAGFGSYHIVRGRNVEGASNW